MIKFAIFACILVALFALGCDDDSGGCNESTCDSECQLAGWASGSCIGGSCQCSNDCTSHGQCSSDTVCYRNECQDPWGKLYTFTIVGGDLPHLSYDDSSPPDAKVTLNVGSDSCSTREISDSYNPEWNHSCDITVHEGTNWTWTMYDVDIAFDDEITSSESAEIKVSTIKNGGATWTLEDGGTDYSVLRININPK